MFGAVNFVPLGRSGLQLCQSPPHGECRPVLPLAKLLTFPSLKEKTNSLWQGLPVVRECSVYLFVTCFHLGFR